MLERSEALKLVSGQLRQKAPSGMEYVVVDDHTIEKPFGWIFFYQSRTFLETGVAMHRLAGNGPVFVNKMTGEIDFFGSIPPLDVILAAYEKKLEGGDQAVPAAQVGGAGSQALVMLAEFSSPHLGLTVRRSDDGSHHVEGAYQGAAVVQAFPVNGGDHCVLLLDPDASKVPKFENLVCIDRSGQLIWTARLPTSPDVFVKVERHGSIIVATTWSGLRLELSEETGREITRSATK